MSLDRQDDEPPPLPLKWTCPICGARADTYPDSNKTRAYGIDCQSCAFNGDRMRRICRSRSSPSLADARDHLRPLFVGPAVRPLARGSDPRLPCARRSAGLDSRRRAERCRDLGIDDAARRAFRRRLPRPSIARLRVVIAEALDRLSRDLGDTAKLYQLLTFHQVKLHTISGRPDYDPARRLQGPDQFPIHRRSRTEDPPRSAGRRGKGLAGLRRVLWI
jgi:hypothetical protein